MNTNDFNEKIAKLAVNYAIGVKPGDHILIDGSEIANDLLKEIYIEVLKAGGHPFIRSRINGLAAVKYKYANEAQLKYISPLVETIFKQFQGQINVFADNNRQKMALVPPEKIKIANSSPKLRELIKIQNERITKKEYKWVIVPFPCDAFAQDAKMDTASYREFVYQALALDKADPVGHWKKVQARQAAIIQKLEIVENIHVLGEDTDLTLSVKNRPWENCCGNQNLPDGEVFTSPIETSINGHIRFTYPGIYQGKEIANIYLEFKEGKVVKGMADSGQDLLDTILSIENANKIGEFAIGTNYGITKFTKNMLFDEKMGGTLHMALGMGFAETKSENTDCVIHWDILKDMKSADSQITADGEIIYQAGKWLI